jgi:hypothetical protein
LRNAERPFEGGLALFEPVETEQRDAFEAMKFRLPLAPARLLLLLQPSLAAARAAACSPYRARASQNRARP